ncbi:hypothetical protein FAF33_007155 [Staphylococcus haemolyticus]|uniref:hypothetical protein n=1 Tax=Staphylococcus haemolyticus TaxID=1283 RepID=UPI0010BE33CE|nr:hypothetical protein [Staphylococcus haemolyticus]TXD08253.1 hypothetical protein FAF33_007155 [Staphylococcus haemolyticus]
MINSEELKNYDRDTLLNMVHDQLNEVYDLVEQINDNTQYQVSSMVMFAIHESDLRKAKDLSGISTLDGRPQMLAIAMRGDRKLMPFIDTFNEMQQYDPNSFTQQAVDND